MILMPFVWSPWWDLEGLLHNDGTHAGWVYDWPKWPIRWSFDWTIWYETWPWWVESQKVWRSPHTCMEMMVLLHMVHLCVDGVLKPLKMVCTLHLGFWADISYNPWFWWCGALGSLLMVIPISLGKCLILVVAHKLDEVHAYMEPLMSLKKSLFPWWSPLGLLTWSLKHEELIKIRKKLI